MRFARGFSLSFEKFAVFAWSFARSIERLADFADFADFDDFERSQISQISQILRGILGFAVSRLSRGFSF